MVAGAGIVIGSMPGASQTVVPISAVSVARPRNHSPVPMREPRSTTRSMSAMPRRGLGADAARPKLAGL
jgi:hypothetical protein